MKKKLRIVTAMLCVSVYAFGQQATVLRPTAVPQATSSVNVPVYNPSAGQNSSGQEVQMVACTDKVTYCDRYTTTIGTDKIGGAVNGFPALFQLFPDYTGTITQAYATLKRYTNNTLVRIGIFPLSGGIPTTTYIAYYEASVTSGTFTEYGGNLTGTANVTDGFALGVFISPTNPNDSANVGYRTDTDIRNLSFSLDPGTGGVESNHYFYTFDADYLMRPKISFNAPTVTVSGNPSSGCAGTPISFSDNVTGMPVHYNGSLPVVYNNPITSATYSWNFGDAGTSTSAPPVNHTYAASGSYTVTYTPTFGGWTTTCPASPATTTEVINGASPSVSITASANPVCPTGTSNFIATPTNGGTAPTYVWKKNGIQVGTGSTYSGSSWAANDIMTCEMVSNAACAPTTAVISNSIIMYLQPISFSSYNYVATGLSVSFTSTAANAVTWAWNFGDAGTSASATPVHNYATGGTYTVDLTVTNSCGQTNVSSINITVSSTSNTSGGNTGLHEKELLVNVNAFPNPVNNELNIGYSINHTTDVTIEVLNTLGQVVSTQVIHTTSAGTAHVSMENMATGLYFVRFTAGENNIQMLRVIHE